MSLVVGTWPQGHRSGSANTQVDCKHKQSDGALLVIQGVSSWLPTKTRLATKRVVRSLPAWKVRVMQDQSSFIGPQGAPMTRAAPTSFLSFLHLSRCPRGQRHAWHRREVLGQSRHRNRLQVGTDGVLARACRLRPSTGAQLRLWLGPGRVRPGLEPHTARHITQDRQGPAAVS